MSCPHNLNVAQSSIYNPATLTCVINVLSMNVVWDY